MKEAVLNNINNVAIISAIGIDVAKDTLGICISYNNARADQCLTIANQETEIIKLAKAITSYSGKIVMESTGRHHLLSAIILTEQGFDVRVINPLLTQKYTKATIRKVKTDKKDASMLAEIASQEKQLPSSFSLGRKALNLRKKLSLITSLEKQLQQLQAMINDYLKTKETLKLSLSGNEKQVLAIVNKLKRQKDKLEQEVEREVRELSDNDADQINRFNSIPGVSIYVAALTNFFFSLDHLESSKQWIAYSGLDVSVRQSGVWQGRGKLTKRGNPYLRKRLYSAAWGAVMTNDQFRVYYDHLKSRGRNHTEALVIIARKLIRIMFSLTKNQTVFDPTGLLFVS